jgi:hypothetical protein
MSNPIQFVTSEARVGVIELGIRGEEDKMVNFQISDNNIQMN